MTVWSRNYLPRFSSPPVLRGPLFSISDSGKVQTRSTQRVGWTWEERYLLLWDDILAGGADSTRKFLARADGWFRAGTQLDVTHQDLTLQGAGGGTPLVDGADQTGSAIDTKGWPNSTAVMLAGDVVTFASIDTVYMTTSDTVSDGSGDAVLNIVPPIFEGGEPADEAPVTIGGSVVFKAKLSVFDQPAFGPNMFIAPRIVWVEDP